MWSETLLQASFKGITFDVERTSDQVQRSIVANEYPYRDGAEGEDLGLGAWRPRFSAIVWGDDYESRLAALLGALRSADAGELVHPVFGVFEKVLCSSWSIEHEADFRDGCKLNLEFMESRASDRIFESPSPIIAGEAVTRDADTARAAADAGLVARVEKVKTGPVPLQLSLRAQMQAAMGKLRALVDTTALKQRLSALDPLFYPQAYVADARNVLDRALQGLPFGGRNILFGSSGGSTGSAASSSSAGGAAAASGKADFDRAAAALSPAAITLLAPNADALMVQAHARTHASCSLAEAAIIVLAGELEQQLLDAGDIERLAATTRAALQAALEDLRAASGPESAGSVAAASAGLRAVAYQVQLAANAVIELRPPVQLRAAPMTGPLRLVAHAFYGDHTRAAELLRLNAWGRRLVVGRGEKVKAYAS